MSGTPKDSALVSRLIATTSSMRPRRPSGAKCRLRHSASRAFMAIRPGTRGT